MSELCAEVRRKALCLGAWELLRAPHRGQPCAALPREVSRGGAASSGGTHRLPVLTLACLGRTVILGYPTGKEGAEGYENQSWIHGQGAVCSPTGVWQPRWEAGGTAYDHLLWRTLMTDGRRENGSRRPALLDRASKCFVL